MGQVYNAAAAVGQVAVYITAVLTVLLAIFCVLAGSSLVRTPEPTGLVVQGSVTSVTAGCTTPEIGRPCTVTASYTYNATAYQSTFPSMRQYAVGDIVGVRILDEADPTKVEEEFPKRAAGWGLIASAVISICVATGLAQFASDSRNFAAGAGFLTFLQAFVAVF